MYILRDIIEFLAALLGIIMPGAGNHIELTIYGLLIMKALLARLLFGGRGDAGKKDRPRKDKPPKGAKPGTPTRKNSQTG